MRSRQEDVQTMSLRSLEEAVRLAKYKHSFECPGEGLIPLGIEDEFYFDFNEETRRDYWISNGIVYALMNCPQAAHNFLSGLLLVETLNKINESVGMKICKAGLNSTTLLRNSKACHSVFEKEPDGAVYLKTNCTGGQKSPVLVIEVASTHETMHILMCEMAAWFEAPLDVKYSFAANIRKAKDGYVVELFLFENPNAIIPDETKREMHLNMVQEFQSKKLARRLASFPPQQILKSAFVKRAGKLIFVPLLI